MLFCETIDNANHSPLFEHKKFPSLLEMEKKASDLLLTGEKVKRSTQLEGWLP